MKKIEIEKLALEMVKICPSCFKDCEEKDEKCSACGHQFPRYKIHTFTCEKCCKKTQTKVLAESNSAPYHICHICLEANRKWEDAKRKRELEEKKQKEYEEWQRKYQESLKRIKPKRAAKKKRQTTAIYGIENKDISEPTIISKIQICGSCGKPIYYNHGFPKCGCSD